MLSIWSKTENKLFLFSHIEKLILKLAKQNDPCYCVSLRYLAITTESFYLKFGASWLQ